jgi:hypothetical protein
MQVSSVRMVPSAGGFSPFGPRGICLAFDFRPNSHTMEYRGIGYTIRARIEREQWSVAIHPAGIEMAGRVINGPRHSAELQAHSMINRWLEKHPAQKY